jgi:hypothetical protein
MEFKWQKHQNFQQIKDIKMVNWQKASKEAKK